MVTLYGIPRTVVRGLRWAWSQPLLDLIWFVVAIGILVFISVYLWAISPFLGSLWSFAIVGALWEDDIREIVLDILLRRWAET